jgi:diaminopimelate decarboxylase
MASNYNSRLRAAEYLVDGSEIIEIRKAESYEDLIKLEQY